MLNILRDFETTCSQYPNKTAVAMREKTITYQQLETNARRMGTLLCQVNHRPIGVFANRTLEPAVQFLAVVYSGNFYVPLDPNMPIEKLQAIICDTEFPYILGMEENKATMDLLSFDGDFLTLADMREELCPFPSTGDDDPLYMVYTSGSTGEPKGVVKSHRSMCSYLAAFLDVFPVGPDEVIGNQTPFFFDASAKDFYLMLKTGATLEIIPTELFSMPPMLIEYLNEKKITFASWVPTALSLVAQLNPFSLVKPQYLRRMFFVGEVMPIKHLNKWREALPHVQYVNLYGQSELAGVCCFYQVIGEYAADEVLPMGKPFANCHIHLMSDGKEITESHKVGEIYIVSTALATGYYHDPKKTAEAFVMRDFGLGPELCFKTGDFAQYDESKNLIFSARQDAQIKHMGHRIELGEIESVAGALPEIERCCCIYQSERRKIVLFCSIARDSTLSGREIQSLLRKKLSAYMVPGKVVVLDQLPLNANGKIDRPKLKEMQIKGEG